MKKQNKVAYIAYCAGVISFCIMMLYVLVCFIDSMNSIDVGDGEEVIASLPWMLGVLVGGLAETGICFVIAEVVEKLDDINRCLYESLTLLRKSSNDRENAAKLYDEKLPEL